MDEGRISCPDLNLDENIFNVSPIKQRNYQRFFILIDTNIRRQDCRPGGLAIPYPGVAMPQFTFGLSTQGLLARFMCRTLVPQRKIRDQIVGSTPQQMKLPFALWSRPASKALIRERFGIDMQGRLVGKYLKRWGFAPQRPVKRALEQRPEEVSRWLDATYPTIKGRRSGRGRHLLG